MTKEREQRTPPPIPDGGVWAVTSNKPWECTVYEREGRSILDFMVRTGPVELDFFSLDPRLSPNEVDDITSNSRYAGCVFPGQFMKCQVLEPAKGVLEVGGSVRLSFDRAGMTAWMQGTYGSKAPELIFEDVAMTGADEEQPAEAATFEVMVDENSHHGEDAYLSESFASAEEALDHARQIVDEFFEGMSGKTAEELFEQFTHFGDSPYIPGVEFSAREYARARCAELGEGLRDARGVSDEGTAPRSVDCSCNPDYQRCVLTPHPSSSLDYKHVGVLACLHCGRLGVAEAIIDEPRPHDVRVVGYRPIELAEELRGWLQQWPRLTTRGLEDDEVFLPASFRAETLDELRRAEERAAAEQKDMRWSARLTRAGVPAEPPPETIPDFLEEFRGVLEGLELTDATPLEELVQRAAQAGGAARLACDRLLARADLAGDLAGLLPPRGSELDQAALDIVGTMRLGDDPRITSKLHERIAQAAPSDEFEVHRIAATVSRLGASAQPLVTALEALAGRIDPSEDYYLHKSVLDTIERISE